MGSMTSCTPKARRLSPTTENPILFFKVPATRIKGRQISPFWYGNGCSLFIRKERGQNGNGLHSINPLRMERTMAESVAIRKASSILDEIQEMRDRVMRRALEIFENNGGSFGRDLDDWLQAEQELLWRPAVELRETNDGFLIEAATSGVDPRDLDIEVTSEDIVLKADKQHEHQQDKGIVHICEFPAGKMFRSIHLPKRINPDKVRAEFKNGLLRVTAEFAEETRTRKIKPEAA
jgi:HSP20 family protein